MEASSDIQEPSLCWVDYGPIAASIFFDSVHNGPTGCYTPEEKTAWGGEQPRPTGWNKRVVALERFVRRFARMRVGGFHPVNASQSEAVVTAYGAEG